MSYILEITTIARKDIEKHIQAGDKKLLAKLNTLFDELREHPSYGTGKPERLKHYPGDTWSRRITDKHRLIYRIHDKKVTVLILSAWGHYSDK